MIDSSSVNISVITPVLNNIDGLKICSQSLLAQNYNNWEQIIVDGSSDRNQISDFFRNVDSRITVKWSEPRGIYDAINSGIKLATGRYIIIVHSDDFVADSNAFQIASEAIEYQNVDILSAKVFYINSVGRIIRKWAPITNRLDLTKPPPHTGSFISRSIYEKVGLYSVDFAISGDYEFFARLDSAGFHEVTPIDRYFICMRIGGKSTNGISSYLSSFFEDIKVLNFYNKPWWMAVVKRLRKFSLCSLNFSRF